MKKLYVALFMTVAALALPYISVAEDAVPASMAQKPIEKPVAAAPDSDEINANLQKAAEENNSDEDEDKQKEEDEKEDPGENEDSAE